MGLCRYAALLVAVTTFLFSAVTTSRSAAPADEAVRMRFIVSAMNGDVATVEALLAAGLDVNSQNAFGVTALEIASEWGHFDVVQLLGRYKADPNIPTKMGGQTAVMVASQRGHTRIVEFLLKSLRANPNFRSAMLETTALIVAVEEQHPDVVELLLNHGAEINAQNSLGATALMWAAERNNHEIAKLLLARKGLNCDLRDKRGRTALDIAPDPKMHTLLATTCASDKSR